MTLADVACCQKSSVNEMKSGVCSILCNESFPHALLYMQLLFFFFFLQTCILNWQEYLVLVPKGVTVTQHQWHHFVGNLQSKAAKLQCSSWDGSILMTSSFQSKESLLCKEGEGFSWMTETSEGADPCITDAKWFRGCLRLALPFSWCLHMQCSASAESQTCLLV